MSSLIARLESVLRTYHPDLLAALAPGASSEQLDALEDLAGRPLPQMLRDLLAWRNGVGDKAARATIDGPWSFMSVQAIIDAVEMLREMLEYEQDWKEQNWWGHDWIPFLEDGCGDHICVDLDGGGTLIDDGIPFDAGIAGQIIDFDHAAELRVIEAPSLEVWLTALIQAVEDGVLRPETEQLAWGWAYALESGLNGPYLHDVIRRIADPYPIFLVCPNHP